MIRKLTKKEMGIKISKMKKINTNIDQIEWVDIKSIKLWKDNPRKNIGASKKLAPLIKEHGFKSPLVVWKKNKTIYKGNTTYLASQILGLKKVPVAFVDFPSLVSAKAYGIADNKSGEFSEWDSEVLNVLMKSKEMKKPEKTGFQKQELDLLEFSESDQVPASPRDGDLATIKIICKPSKKEKVFEYLERCLLRKFPKDVVIK